MDESLLHEIFGVDRTYRCTGSETRHGGVFIAVEPKEELRSCPACGSRDVIRKGQRTRRIQTLPIGFHPVFLEVQVPRCQCKACQKVFEIAPPFAYAHYTRTLSQFVYKLSGVMTLSDVSELTLLSWDTVKDIVKTGLAKDYRNPPLKAVRRLAIDEIHLGRKRKFYTLVMDLDTGRILWAAPGRGQGALRGFWRRLRLSRAKIEAVAIDMSAAYWSAVLENLPRAAIVFDRFHIMKLMNERLDELRRAMVREAEGPLKKTIKGTRFLLLRNSENLQDDHLPRLDEALRLNEPLLLGWYLKEELRELWNQPDGSAMKNFLRDWCDKALDTAIPALTKMAKTLLTHATGVLNYAKHRITSGRMEGINNKIKTLTKKSYGFRDEDFFLLRLLSLHHSKYKLIG